MLSKTYISQIWLNKAFGCCTIIVLQATLADSLHVLAQVKEPKRFLQATLSDYCIMENSTTSVKKWPGFGKSGWCQPVPYQSKNGLCMINPLPSAEGIHVTCMCNAHTCSSILHNVNIHTVLYIYQLQALYTIYLLYFGAPWAPEVSLSHVYC